MLGCRFAPDVITFAQRKGLYPTTATAAAFDFSAAYDPINFAGARLADARVWGMMVRAEVAGIEQYGSFDIILDHFPPSLSSNPPHTVLVPRSFIIHADWELIGAWHPTL